MEIRLQHPVRERGSPDTLSGAAARRRDGVEVGWRGWHPVGTSLAHHSSRPARPALPALRYYHSRCSTLIVAITLRTLNGVRVPLSAGQAPLYHRLTQIQYSGLSSAT